MKAFHIDLSHVQDTCGILVKFRSHKLQLQAHDANTMAEARTQNSALAALSLETCTRCFTHFVHVPEDLFPSDIISRVRVIRPHQDPKVHIPDLILMGTFSPESYQRQYFQRVCQELALQETTYLPAVLQYYGLEEFAATALSGETLVETLIDASYLVTTVSSASTLVQLHPELANIQPYYQTIIANTHVLPSPFNPHDPDQVKQYNLMRTLNNAIATLVKKNQPWAPVVPCTDYDGSPVTAQYDFGNLKTGDTIHRQDLDPSVSAVCADPVLHAKQTAFTDTRLQNQTWTVNHGTASVHSEQNQQVTDSSSETVGDPQYDWNLAALGMNFGLYLDPHSITVTNDQFSIACENWFVRTLGAYYELLDETGNPTTVPPALIQTVPPACTIMGIPYPDTQPPPLEIDLQGASQFNLVIGSLGTWDWDSDVSYPAAFATGIFQLLIPGIGLSAAVLLNVSKLVSDFLGDWKPIVAFIIRACAPTIAWMKSAGGKDPDKTKVVNYFVNQGIGLLMQVGFMKLNAALAEQVAAEEITEDAAAEVGLFMKVVAIVAAGAALAETTGEVLASPASMRIKVSRACTVKLTLTPDPAHGEAGKPETAVWPAVADHYEVLLEYKTSATSLSVTGKMLPTTNGNSIPIEFDNVLAGTQAFFRIKANFYSSTGWLCGYWENDWTAAVPTNGGTLDLGSHAITEILVPLTQDSQYQFKEKIVYQSGDYVWQAEDANQQPIAPPSTPITNTDCSPNATGKLCQLVGMTFNTSAFQAGYIWRSAGQNLPLDGANNPPSAAQEYVIKNLSVLQDPGSRLKNSQIGFSAQPAIAYSPVDSATTTTIDQRNFVLDPRNGQMHLRQVTLDNGTNNFGLTANPLLSWGCFPIANLDAIVVHPNNAVVGISYQYHKLMILNLPNTAVPDDQAPQAALLSGKGLRQGLLLGPMAMEVTADGRILILEAMAERVQAFDVKGNPVACFASSQPGFSVTTTDGGTAFAAAMAGGTVPDGFQTALRANSSPLATLDTLLIPNLDSGSFQPKKDPVITALSKKGIILVYDPNNMGDRTASAYITVNTAGSAWTITDPVQNQIYQVLNQGQNGLNVFETITKYQIHAIAPGQHWTLYDIYAAVTYDIQRDATQAGQFDVTIKQSFFSIQPKNSLPGSIHYLDLAVESKGFIYILYYINDGSQPTDYYLDIYDPAGNHLSTVPDTKKTKTPQNIVAGKIAVDKFRNLFSLNYETIANPPAGPEPSVSQWEPTTPLFAIPNGSQAAQDFNSANISVVIGYFSQYGNIALNYSSTSITTLSSAGYWAVKDSANSASYQVVWSGDSLLVYQIPV